MKVTAFVAAALSVAAVAEAANSHGVRRQDTAHHQHARAPAPTPAPEADPEALLGGGLKSLLNKFAATPVKQASADPAAVTEVAGGKPKLDLSKLTLPKTNAQTGRADITTIMSRLANMFKGFGQEPTVTLRQGKYTGVRSSALFQQEWFLGIPFAAKQDKSTRFLSPRKTPDSTSSFNASSLAPACPQPNNYLMNFDADPSSRSEDCLTVNVWSPLGASAGNVGGGKLPVLFWLYGGGEIGNAHNVYNSSALVLQSILQFQPMIVITPNYRGNSFGFLAGETMTRLTKRNKATINPGLQDVTAALEWTRDNIAAFGGDPNKITLAGQSSGAFNVGAQMLKDGATPNVKPIYRAAVMISGTSSSEPAPASDSAFAQENFQRIVDVVGCTKKRSDFPSTEAFDDALLDCLRNVDPIELGEATFKPLDYRWGVNPSLYWIMGPKFYGGNQPFQPTKDGVYHRADGSAEQIRQGLYPDVPLLIGNVRDEGTIFVSRALRPEEIKGNLKIIGFTNPNAPGVDALVDDILAAYPDVPTQGAPYLPGYRGPDSRFGAGNQFERLAAILGDFAFVSKRRFILDRWIGGNGMSKFASPVWSYMFNETDAYQPPEDPNGIPHGYDPSYWFAGRAFAPNPAWLSAASASLQASKSFVAFVNKMNPNAFGNLYWPQYTAQNRVQMMIKGTPKLIGDDYRPQMSIFSSKRVTDLSNM